MALLVQHGPSGDTVLLSLGQSLVGEGREVFIPLCIREETAVFQGTLDPILLAALALQKTGTFVGRRESAVDRIDRAKQKDDQQSDRPSQWFDQIMPIDFPRFARNSGTQIGDQNADKHTGQQCCGKKDRGAKEDRLSVHGLDRVGHVFPQFFEKHGSPSFGSLVMRGLERRPDGSCGSGLRRLLIRRQSMIVV